MTHKENTMTITDRILADIRIILDDDFPDFMVWNAIQRLQALGYLRGGAR